MKIKTIILISCLLVTGNLLGQSPNSIEIVSLKSKPIVVGYLNGKKAYFLLDTGSDLTIINKNAARKYGFKLITNYNNKLIEGLGSTNTEIKRVGGIFLKMNDAHINTKFYAFNLNNIVRSLELKTQKQIVGIIGSDVMKKYNFSIDFGNKLVHFQETKRAIKAKKKKSIALTRN